MTSDDEKTGFERRWNVSLSDREIGRNADQGDGDHSLYDYALLHQFKEFVHYGRSLP